MKVLCLRTNSGTEPLAWTNEDLSVRDIRKVFKRFRFDGDVECAVVLDYTRLYDTKREVKQELPEFLRD